jgi:hypothetical protein
MPDHLEGEPGPAQRAVEALSESFTNVDADRKARIEAARAVARQLDRSSNGKTGAAGMATATLARELRACLDELRQVERDAAWNGLVERLVGGEDD